MLWNLTATSHVNRSLFASQSSEKGELHFPLGFIIVQTLIFSLLFPWTSISPVLVSKMWPSASWSFWCLCGFGSGFFFWGGGRGWGAELFICCWFVFVFFFFFAVSFTIKPLFCLQPTQLTRTTISSFQMLSITIHSLLREKQRGAGGGEREI